MSSPLTFLCITTYEKGQEFMRECKRQGCRVFLLTAEKLRDADWPRESLDDVFYIPAELPIPEIVKAVTYLARDNKIDRIVALDEFDMETASTLREHMRIPGMGLTTMRYFRDKLAMRMQALEHGIRVPDFIPVLNHDDIRYYLDHVSGPWVLKLGRKHRHRHQTDRFSGVWPILDSLASSGLFCWKNSPRRRLSCGLCGLRRSGVLECQPLWPADGGGAEGGIFPYLLERVGGGRPLRLNRELIIRIGRGGVSLQFIRARSVDIFIFWNARASGRRTSARWWKSPLGQPVAGVGTSKSPAAGTLPAPAGRSDYAGLICRWPGRNIRTLRLTTIPKLLYASRRHHAGLVLRSSDPARIQSLLETYSRRFAEEFLAIEPPGTKPAA
jgi:hypothetical protein